MISFFFSPFMRRFFIFPLFFGVLVFPGISGATALDAALDISSGSEHSCSALSDGTVKCWGANWGGQLGNGTTNDQLSPVSVSSISNAVAAFVGMYHSCAVLSDGTAKCWGSNWSGQLGDGTETDRDTPVIVNGLSGVTKMAGGSDHTCALLSSGSVQCWGGNQNGQLGNGTTSSSSTPVSVSGIATAVDITAGEFHTCAVLSNGVAKCWGKNTYGQLGDASTTQRTSPVSVSGLSGATHISAGAYHTCAVLSDGTAKCWGDNTSGELGNNSTTSSSTPVSVSGITSAVAIAANQTYDTDTAHSCAVLSDGMAKCWGDGLFGQLGNGSSPSSPQKTPVLVSGLSGATSIALAYATSCARLSNNTVQCWGDDYAGTLGDGSGDSSRNTPGLVVGLTVEGGETACTESDWSFTLDPSVCPESEVQTKYWTQTNANCSGGVSHPASEQVSCPYNGGSGGESFWEQAGNALYYLLGNIGIGTNSPQEKLDVNGNIRLTGNILPNGDLCIGVCQ